VQQFVHEEFGKPVRAALHPKFTVALGAAATAAHSAQEPTLRLAPVSRPGSFPRQTAASAAAGRTPAGRRRRKWLVPVAAAAVVGLVAAVTTLVLTAGSEPVHEASAGSGSTGTESTTTTSAPAAPSIAPPVGGSASTSTRTEATQQTRGDLPPLWVYDNGPVPPFHSLIASTDNWAGVDFGQEGARQKPISAAPDGQGGLRVTWAGGSPGQIYIQNIADARDLTSYVNSRGALVFDVVVHTAPADRTTVAVHCIYPCVSEVEATKMFRGMPPGGKATVKIPLTCFTAHGLNAAMVNTPFLVYTSGAFDATFSNIRWEANVTDATPCTDLS
jgi:molecular chaperone DnaK